MNTESEIGGNIELEKMLDEFLEHMAQFGRKTSLTEQKKILRTAVKPAVTSLRARTRATWPKRTGRAWRATRTTAKNSKTRPGIAFTTYGWSNKGIKPIYTKRLKRDGVSYRERPKPATYIGIWGDLGTKRQQAHGIFKSEWASHKEQIKKSIQNQITDIMKKAKISK